ncbi:complement C1q-like protein 2 [Pygocentrus nattereri]|uniref:C1q domain-containing protein n=1 Tax=Pygocentrus nattereri TaxID=42514 RepID=A0A3B4EPF3_PYGNA|nr:complement C1q-like protein 2 [Pygocentrus nattereri]
MGFVKALLLGLSTLSAAWTQDPLVPTIDIVSELMELKAAVAQLKEEVKVLQEGQPKVAFTATLEVPGRRGHIGPHSKDITLVFKHVKTNIGEGFNSTTGVFTAPVRGVYFFAFNCFAGASKPMSSALFKNNVNVVSIWDQPSSGDSEDNGFNAATLLLDPGDRVYIKLWKNTQIALTDGYSTFSGFLLYPLK